MNHSMIVKKSLMYLNRVFAVLMVVVVSLNIEQIFHNKRIQNFDHIQSQNLELTLKIERCKICQNEGLEVLNRLNIAGALLSLVLAIFSLLFAHKSGLFHANYKWFVPACLISTILTIVYFIVVITTHITKECTDSKDFDPLWHCDAEFTYSMEQKIKPLSILMLACVPQFVARSCSLLTEKYAKKDTKNDLCNKWHSVEMEDKTSNLKSKSKHHFENSNLKPEYEIDLLRPASPIEFGFRELPIDCPPETKSRNQILPKLEFYNEENDAFIEKSRQDYCDNELFCNQGFDQVIFENKLENYKLINQKRIFMRNSSLSTISEEKTFATLTEVSNQHVETSKVNPSRLVCSVIDEFQDKTCIMNEIIHVFQPSSKDGCFSRNVPIRLTSPRKSINAFNSPMSLRSSSSCSPCSNEFDLSPRYEQSILLSNIVMAKKIRFVKRLKNRIENKSGKQFGFKNLDLKLRLSPMISKGKKCHIKKRKFLSFSSLSKDSKEKFNDSGIINHANNISPVKKDTKNNENDIFLPKLNVEPVFF